MFLGVTERVTGPSDDTDVETNERPSSLPKGDCKMLVLSRQKDQEIMIGDHVTVKVLQLGGGRVRIGIEAPPQVHIRRGELPKREAPVSGVVHPR